MIDILLGVEIFMEVMCHGWRSGPHNSPTALNTEFGWVLAGDTGPHTGASVPLVSAHLIAIQTGDNLLCKFWEMKENTVANYTLTLEERCAVEHFNLQHSCVPDGKFVVPLPKRPMATKLGESCSQAVHCFLSFERSIHSKGIFPDVQVMEEYFDQGHAKEVP